MKAVIFISAHPDDHITSAGFLRILKKKGYELFEIVLTSGSGGYKEKEQKNEIARIRQLEFEEAMRLLGVVRAYCLNYDEHALRMNKKNVERITRIIREIRPEIIIIPNRDDYHEAHIETNRIAIKAIRTAMKVRKLELGRPTEPLIVLEWEHSVPKQPDVIIEISEEWKFKEELMKCYKSQINEIEIQKTRSLNEYRGSMIGRPYAEAFKTTRFIPLRLDKIIHSNKEQSCGR